MTDIVERARKFPAFDFPEAESLIAEMVAEIERLREEVAMIGRAKFCDEETIAEQQDEIERLRHMYESSRADANAAIARQQAEIERLRREKT